MSERKNTSPSIVLLVTTIGAFMTSFAGSSVTVALPPLGAELGLDGVTLNWVTTAFVLGSAFVLLPMGRFGDIIGRRSLLLIGFAVYGTGAALSAVATSGTFLVAMRALSGFGASMLMPTVGAILVASFPPQERGRVLGINIAAVYFGLSAGPFLGGLLTTFVGWRGLFWINAGLAAVVLAFAGALFKDQWANARGEKMDWVGTFISALALLGLIIGLSSLPSLVGIALFLGGLLALGGFVLWELRSSQPLLDVRIFQGNPTFAMSNLAAMISYSATFSVAFFLSLYLQVVRGLAPEAAGLILVAQPIIQAVFSPLTGKLSDRVPARRLASAGMGLCAVGLAVLAFVAADTPLFVIIAALVLLGLGFALFSSPNTNAVMGSVEPKQVGVASAAISTMRVVGMSASMGIALVLFSVFLGQKAVSAATSAHFLSAMQFAFAISAVLCFLGIFASLARHRSASPVLMP